MAKRSIADRVFRLKISETVRLNGIPQDMEFKSGEEFHIVADVVYMRGFPLPAGMQTPVKNWILKNEVKFIDDTRIF